MLNSLQEWKLPETLLAVFVESTGTKSKAVASWHVLLLGELVTSL